MATVIVAIIVFGLVGLITGKGIYDKKHHKMRLRLRLLILRWRMPFHRNNILF